MRRVVACAALALAASAAAAGPASVTAVGSFQSEAGCASDWDPACAATHLTYDAGDAVWQGAFAMPAGSYEYKVALDDAWDASYPAVQLPLAPAETTVVKFYYDDATHDVADSSSGGIPVVAGDFQSELGCPGDWQPDCLRSWLRDPDGDGRFVFATTALPPGSYACKVAIGESWDENYGAGGAPGGANIGFSVVSAGDLVTFRFDGATHVLQIAPEPGASTAALAGVAMLVARRRAR